MIEMLRLATPRLVFRVISVYSIQVGVFFYRLMHVLPDYLALALPSPETTDQKSAATRILVTEVHGAKSRSLAGVLERPWEYVE